MTGTVALLAPASTPSSSARRFLRRRIAIEESPHNPLTRLLDNFSEDVAFVNVLVEEKFSRLCACGDGLKPCGDGLKPLSKRGEMINLDLQKENEELNNKNEELASRIERED